MTDEFLTEEQMRSRTKLGAGDREIIRSMKTGEGLISIKSMEQLKALAKAAKETFDYSEHCISSQMTFIEAVYIRGLRVLCGYSWRAVAEECYAKEWPGWERWQPPSNQLVGMALCKKAAEFFNEDYMAPPWN